MLFELKVVFNHFKEESGEEVSSGQSIIFSSFNNKNAIIDAKRWIKRQIDRLNEEMEGCNTTCVSFILSEFATGSIDHIGELVLPTSVILAKECQGEGIKDVRCNHEFIR